MFFKEEYNFLSNFHYCLLKHNGITFTSSEHLYQALKSTDINVQRRIASVETPAFAKRAGRKIVMRPDWENVKDEIMLYTLRLKFSQQSLREKLFKTNPIEIVEENYWHDNYWGACVCQKCVDILHKNMLGELLMHVRNEIINNSYLTFEGG